MAKYIVTGGGGFVGKAIARELSSLGHEVISVARGEYPELASFGIRHERLDLSVDLDRLKDLANGADAIFHTAAKVDMWGDYEEFYRANVIATENVIAACNSGGVRKMIFTSSPSVIADGKDLCAVDESYKYPTHYSAYYPQTKALAENRVLAANNSRLSTIALRPHLIFGPGDTNLVPTILEKARAGKLMQIGTGKNMTDLTFIVDCVQAHLKALKALEENKSARGRAYFISQGQPVNLWNWINEVLQRHDLPKIKRTVPVALAKSLAWVLEAAAKIIPGKPEPLLTRFLVCEMATSHFFNISAAKRELGFHPQFSIEEAMQLTFDCHVAEKN